MNLVDFLVYSPISIWALVCAIVFSTVMLVRLAHRIIAGQERIADALAKDNGKITGVTEELRKDTLQLKESIADVRKSIDYWLDFMRKIYWYIPFGSDKK